MTAAGEAALDNSKQLSIDTGACLRGMLTFCVSVELLLFTLDYHVNMAGGSDSYPIRRLFDTASEDSLAGWFSIMQTALIAVTVWLVWAVVRQQGSRSQQRGWAVLALFFTYMALDDGAFLHERVGTWFDTAGRASPLGSWMLELFPSYRWQLVFMPLFATMGVFVFVFLLRELRGWKPKTVVFIALGFLATAVFMDFFEGLEPDHPLNPYTALTNAWHLDYWTARTFDQSPYDTLLHFSRSFEECLEMFAMTLLWIVFLQHLARVADGFQLRFEQTPLFTTEKATNDKRLPVHGAAPSTV